jgi:flagellar hook protein FlgE
MGLFGAMTTAVGGLRAQAFALENVSGNIANSQTTGFKRVDTSFADLVPDSTTQLQLAGGVLARSRGTNNVQGDIQNASINTFMAINGPGYFIVQKPTSFPDGTPVFTGVDLFSRRGDFQLDKDGYLNGTGYYLKVLRVDPTTGNISGSVPEVLQFSNDFLPAQPTTLVEYRANLATFPRTAQSDESVPGSERLNPNAFSVNPTVAGTGTVVANDVPTFLAQSIAGGAVTVYDELGSSVNIQLCWAKLASDLVNIQGSPIAADTPSVGVGTGVSIAPDSAALLQGGVGGLAGADTLDSLGFSNGETISISDDAPDAAGGVRDVDLHRQSARECHEYGARPDSCRRPGQSIGRAISDRIRAHRRRADQCAASRLYAAR